MQELQQIVKSLSKSEINFIKHYYRFNPEKKRLQLFTWVLNEKVETDEEAAEKLYGGKGAAYSHLKGRLKKDMLNLLVFQDGDKHSESERFQNEVDVLRLIIQGKVLFNRKVNNYAIKNWKEALNKAIEFEMLPEKLLLTALLSESIGIQKGFVEYERLVSDVPEDVKSLDLIFKAKRNYFNVALPTSFLKNNEAEFIKTAKLASKELDFLYEKTTSPSIGYFYYLTKINHLSLIKDYASLLEVSSKFIEFILNVKSLRSNSRLVGAYLQHYSACVYLGEFIIGLNSVKLALKYTNKGGPNELTAIEFMFLVLMQMKDDEETKKTLNIGINHSKVKYSKFNQGKWIYYNAIYLFKLADFSNSLFELQKENELLKDKSGWLFGHKLLEIMCYMELEEFDMIEFRVEALRKLLQRQKDKNITRVKTIFNILSSFTKTGAFYKKTYEKESENFQLLHAAKEEYFWDPLGYEIIRFDTWFQSKF